jgi:hypothetical protein
MRTLYGGCWVGEFGWELFCWQGYLRKRSKLFDRCYIACKKGHEILYQDFSTTFPQDIEFEEADMWDCKGYSPPSFEKIFGHSLKKGDEYHCSKKPILRYDHTHRLDNQPLFAKFKEQDFVPYGEEGNYDYDIIIHARNKQNKVNAGMNSNYRNWNLDKWNEFFKKMSKFKIACIGTKKSALHIGGDDKRNVTLKDLCNILKNTKVVVGPSSGPMHLASLCKTPQVLWYGPPYDELNVNRYKKDWNPFNIRVEILRDDKWDVNVRDVVKKVEKIICDG